jgi:hypothetical protein
MRSESKTDFVGREGWNGRETRPRRNFPPLRCECKGEFATTLLRFRQLPLLLTIFSGAGAIRTGAESTLFWCAGGSVVTDESRSCGLWSCYFELTSMLFC